MEYAKLGNTDSEVSKLCVGCMSFGKAGTMHDWTLNEGQSEASCPSCPERISMLKYPKSIHQF